MDTSAISSLYLVPDWITRLIEDYQNEEESSAWDMKLLEGAGRNAVWNMCVLLDVESHGVPGQACYLLERYLFKHLHQLFRPMDVDVEEWENFKRSLVSRIPLLIASCVQLAAKMSSVGLQVNATIVRTCLLCKGVIVSLDDIINSEFQVFSTLGFRVPLWTSVEVAHVLAVEVRLPVSLLDGVALLVDFAEYRRDRLSASVRRIALASPSPSVSAVSNSRCLGTPHLAAGVVAATARYLATGAPDPLPRLAQITRAPPLYIKCVSDVILADLLVDSTDLTQRVVTKRRKRQRSPSV